MGKIKKSPGLYYSGVSFVCVCVCGGKPLHQYMRICPLYTHTHTHTHTNTHTHVYIHINIHTYVSIHAYTSLSLYIYIHMYIYIHAYTHAFIHRMQGAPLHALLHSLLQALLHAPQRARGSWAGEPIRGHRGVGRCSGRLHRCSSRQGPLGHSAQAWPAARGS